MPPRFPLTALCIAALLASACTTGSQTSAPYSIKVNVDEVELTLHADDAQGMPVNDLRASDLQITDNGHPPRRIVTFQPMRNLPIRAGILIDTSSSMEPSRETMLDIATVYAQRVLQQATDQAFVMSFSKRSQTLQSWSGSPAALTAAIARSGNIPSTTALYDTLYAACREQFGRLAHDTTGNFIMLFSDGDDDASYLPLRSAVDMCQQTNTAIYVFRPDSAITGLHNLSDLASLTGGRVFRIGASGAEIDEDLHIIQANLRNQYRLIYNPAAMPHNGAFHRILIVPPDRVAAITTRSGYYAPSH
ncbi:MAG: VWA domain-containing protein [Edaphobacter sp.]|uniref:VWA domain-containing protein n=1 Tax=Edaphobacter sp. TaxID=1934404 RepID=UPI0023A2DEEB|nr:VWA domain-containing protein [Edaphobacter sp.]MDE1176597.1 VWA domain-containing protein [Edaphobacter sp.]